MTAPRDLAPLNICKGGFRLRLLRILLAFTFWMRWLIDHGREGCTRNNDVHAVLYVLLCYTHFIRSSLQHF